MSREAMQMALNALTEWDARGRLRVIEALRTALAQPEPEPVAWISHNAGLYHGKPDESLNPLPLYTAPPKKEWVGLTDEEIREGNKDSWVTRQAWESAAWWAEAKLKEKNT